jgi:PadR family transcriptional regulator, regulatory protein PadR
LIQDALPIDRRTAPIYVVDCLGIRDPELEQKIDMLQGTLDLLILRVVRSQSLHGWAIAKRISDISRDALQVNQGSLYPALYRLERKGFIAAEWGISDEGRRAKFYEITPLGRKQLASVENEWRRFSLAVELVLTST